MELECDKMKSDKNYVLYYDFLNIVACISVIYMHCNGSVHNFSNTSLWKESLIIETLAYWAVPIFFMLSGATLLEYRKKYTTKCFFKKRFMKTVIPFIVWNIIVLFERCWRGDIHIVDLSLKKLTEMVINAKIENVYWFFIPLFAIYLSIPILAILVNNKKCLWYMSACGMITYSLLPFVVSIMGISYNSSIYFPMTSGYVLYAILGYLISITEIKKKYRYVLYLGGIAGIFIRYSMTYVLSMRQKSLNTMSWGYLNLPTLLLSVSIFVLFKYIKWNKLSKNKTILYVIKLISSASFGIYLLHMIIVRNVPEIFGWDVLNWKWRLIGPLIVYSVSLCIVLFIKKIPIIKNIVP